MFLDGLKYQDKHIKNISIVLTLDARTEHKDISSVLNKSSYKSGVKSTSNAFDDIFINIKKVDIKEIRNDSEPVEKKIENNMVDIRNILIEMELIENKKQAGTEKKKNMQQRLCKLALNTILNTPLYYGDIR